MATRNTKTAAEQDESKSAEQTTEVDAPTQQTTTQEQEKADAVPTEPVAADEVTEDEDALKFVEDFEGALGTTSERDRDGKEFDAPYAYLSAQDVARTSDFDDPARSWVSQENSEREEKVALTEVHGTPGQTFRVRELPDRKVVEAAGIDYGQFVAGLPVRPDVPNEAPRTGIPA